MKTCRLLSLLSLLLLFSCQKPDMQTLSDHYPVFKTIYSLEDQNTDSCRLLLNRVKDTLNEERMLSDFPADYYEYQILIAEIQYKSDDWQINPTEIEKAIKFYHSTLKDEKIKWQLPKQEYMHARAHYYMGVNKDEEQDEIESVNQFLQALKILDNMSDVRNRRLPEAIKSKINHFEGLTYNRIGWALYNTGAWDAAIENLHNANQCFEKEGLQKAIALNYELIGDMAYCLKDDLRYLTYYKKADSITNSINDDDDLLQFNLARNQLRYNYNRDKKQDAYERLKKLFREDEDNALNPLVAKTLADFYYEDAIYDSAIYYYEKSFPMNNLNTVETFSKLINSYNKIGKTEQAHQYALSLAQKGQNIMTTTGVRSNEIKLYEKYKADRKQALLQKKFAQITMLLLGAIIAVILINLIRNTHRAKQKRKEEKKHREETILLQNEIEQKIEETKNKDEKIKHLQNRLEKTESQENTEKQKLEEKLDKLMKNPTCKKLIEKVNSEFIKSNLNYSNLHLTETQKAKIFLAIDDEFPGFSHKMTETYPRLTQLDLLYCVLYILGINEKQAAALTGKTYQAVWARSAKMHEIFNSSADIKFILYDMLKTME